MSKSFWHDKAGGNSSMRIVLILIVITDCISVLSLVALAWFSVIRHDDLTIVSALIGSFAGVLGIITGAAFTGKVGQSFAENNEVNNEITEINKSGLNGGNGVDKS
jgi:hypothetical protein